MPPLPALARSTGNRKPIAPQIIIWLGMAACSQSLLSDPLTTFSVLFAPFGGNAAMVYSTEDYNLQVNFQDFKLLLYIKYSTDEKSCRDNPWQLGHSWHNALLLLILPPFVSSLDFFIHRWWSFLIQFSCSGWCSSSFSMSSGALFAPSDGLRPFPKLWSSSIVFVRHPPFPPWFYINNSIWNLSFEFLVPQKRAKGWN